MYLHLSFEQGEYLLAELKKNCTSELSAEIHDNLVHVVRRTTNKRHYPRNRPTKRQQAILTELKRVGYWAYDDDTFIYGSRAEVEKILEALEDKGLIRKDGLYYRPLKKE